MSNGISSGAKRKKAAIVFALLALCVILASLFGFYSPFWGIILLPLGGTLAILAIAISAIVHSKGAFFLAFSSFVLAMIIATAGVIVIFSSPAFEDHFFSDWQKILDSFEKIERRADALEDRL